MADVKYKKIGTAEKRCNALVFSIQGWKLGQLVIGAENMQRLLRGTEVEVNFVQKEFIGYAGRAKLSFNKKAVNLYLVDMPFATVPLYHIMDVYHGRRKSANVSQVVEQEKPKSDPIDGDLEKSF